MNNPLDGRPDSYWDAPPDVPEESYTCPDCGERVDKEVIDCADHAEIGLLPEICEFNDWQDPLKAIDRYRRALDRAAKAYEKLKKRREAAK